MLWSIDFRHKNGRRPPDSRNMPKAPFLHKSHVLVIHASLQYPQADREHFEPEASNEELLMNPSTGWGILGDMFEQ